MLAGYHVARNNHISRPQADARSSTNYDNINLNINRPTLLLQKRVINAAALVLNSALEVALRTKG